MLGIDRGGEIFASIEYYFIEIFWGGIWGFWKINLEDRVGF